MRKEKHHCTCAFFCCDVFGNAVAMVDHIPIQKLEEKQKLDAIINRAAVNPMLALLGALSISVSLRFGRFGICKLLLHGMKLLEAEPGHVGG
jgi:hypothetical protein